MPLKLEANILMLTSMLEKRLKFLVNLLQMRLLFKADKQKKKLLPHIMLMPKEELKKQDKEQRQKQINLRLLLKVITVIM